MNFTTHSPEETKAIAAAFAKTLRGGELVLLEGPLGAGKTTFVQGLAEALGVRGPVRSPTFAVMHAHAADHPTIKRLAHFDFYRFKKPEEARELGLEEWVGQKDTVTVAEWPGLAGAFLTALHVIRITLEPIDAGSRRISIE